MRKFLIEKNYGEKEKLYYNSQVIKIIRISSVSKKRD